MAKKKKNSKDKIIPDTFDFLKKTTFDSKSLLNASNNNIQPKSSPTPQTAPTPQTNRPEASLTQRSQTIPSETRSWPEILSDLSNWTLFPFSIGLEMELIICTNDGAYITGDDMVHRMFEITKEANRIMNQLINYEYEDPSFTPMPEYIRNKLGKMCRTEKDEEKGLVMKVNYEIDGEYIDIDSFARDGNVTAITYILELVTPPSYYAEELAYWASTLFALAKKTLPRDLNIVASAINPASKEYNRGLSQGDHNHIGGFQNEVERAQCYDMIRNFIPHIIALSVNSPIINNQPTDVVKTKTDQSSGKIRYVAPNCVRSLRLQNNTTMLSSNDPKHFIPYLSTCDEANKQYMLQVLQKLDWYDARYQDVFPETDFGTIEVRVMDAQISICRRIGLAMLNEALCYKARKLMEQERWVPDVGSDTLTFNRKGSIERGLISVFKNNGAVRTELDNYDPGFSDYYFGPENKPYRFMFQAVQGMFYYLKDVLKELGFLYSPFMKPLLQSVFGDITYAMPPLAEAEYQLSLYDYKMKNGEDPNILRDLIYFTLEYCKDPLNQPLTGDLNLPEDMR
ncbi:MAG: hypothetical protein GY870_05800 [archaeon]|nr:hypothetical protein [archaeon]